MAIYHLSAQIIGRSAGRSAVAAAAYRAGEKIEDRTTGSVHDYTRKQGVVAKGIALPEGAPEWAKDRAELWQRVEEKETRINSQLSREIIIALPDELTPKQRRLMVDDFADFLAGQQGLAVDWTIHEPPPEGDKRNTHAHLMITTRRFDAAAPDGWGKKARDMNTKDALENIRLAWELCANNHLKEAGREERIDRRTLEAQGIDRMAGEHIGVIGMAIKRRGRKSRRAEEIEAELASAKAPPVTRAEIDKALEGTSEIQYIHTARHLANLSVAQYATEATHMISIHKKMGDNMTPEQRDKWNVLVKAHQLIEPAMKLEAEIENNRPRENRKKIDRYHGR